jgi:hypothetical protein
MIQTYGLSPWVVLNSMKGRRQEGKLAKKYILIDACVAAAAFAPQTTRSTHLVHRSTTLLNGRSTAVEPQFLIPNFCIGEAFAVLEKYRWGASWSRHVNPKTRLTHRSFQTARKEFHEAIHNGTRLHQVELNRYHILCLDLIAPINAAYRIKRDRKRKKNVNPASTYDLLFVAMAIWLQRLHGAADFVADTGDERVALVVKRAKSVKLGRPMRTHLAGVASGIGLAYGPDIYPRGPGLGPCEERRS